MGHQISKASSHLNILTLPNRQHSPRPWWTFQHVLNVHGVRVYDYHFDGVPRQMRDLSCDEGTKIAQLSLIRAVSRLAQDLATCCILLGKKHESIQG